MGSKVTEYSEALAIWVDDSDARHLRKFLRDHKAGDPDAVVDGATLSKLIDQIPKRKNQVIDAVLDAPQNRDFSRRQALSGLPYEKHWSRTPR